MLNKYSLGGNYREYLSRLLLVLAPMLVFLQVGWHDFLGYDDPINIFQNPRVTQFSLNNLLYFWQGPALGLYIPLTYDFWLIIAKLSQLLALGSNDDTVAPQLFHLANLLVHLGTTTLVFLIIKDLVKNTQSAVAGALIFALHPMQVEPVAWASGMKDLLSGFWSLLALRQYLRFCQVRGKSQRIGHYLAASVSFLLALVAKPAAVVIPLMSGLLGWLLLARPWRRVLLELSPWLLCMIPLITITIEAQPLAQQVYHPPIWQRFLVAGDAISFYLYKLVLPFSLGPDYGRLPEVVLDQGWIYLTGILPFLLAGFLFWKASRINLATAGLFVVPLIPVLGLLPFSFQEVSTVADRYLYLAMLAPSLAFARLWSNCLRQRKIRLIMASFLVILAIKSTIQTTYWKEPLVFSSHALEVNPRSWNSYLRYGVALYTANRQEEAIAAFNRALAIKPDFTDALYGLGVAFWDRGENDQATTYFTKVLRLDPVNVPAALGLGDIYRKSGHCDLAIKNYQIAIASELDRAEYHVSLGECYAALGRDAEAVDCFEQAIAAQPDYPEANAQLVILYRKHGELDKANAIRRNLSEAATGPGDP